MRYDYRCNKCKAEFEVEVITTSALEGRRRVSRKCPKCGKKDAKKLIRPTRIIFKGTGFYKTDKENK